MTCSRAKKRGKGDLNTFGSIKFFPFLQKSSISGFTDNSKFANKLADSIGLGIKILNLDLLNEFQGILIYLARFKNFAFLQKNSVSLFAGFTENLKSYNLPISG